MMTAYCIIFSPQNSRNYSIMILISPPALTQAVDTNLLFFSSLY